MSRISAGGWFAFAALAASWTPRRELPERGTYDYMTPREAVRWQRSERSHAEER